MTLIAVVGAILGVFLLCGAAQGPTAPVVVRISVENQDGRPVAGLAASDLEIHSNGQAYEVQVLVSRNEPVTVVCLIDVSASMLSAVGRIGRVTDVTAIGKRSLESAMRKIDPSDRVRIGSFAGRTILSPRFTSDPIELLTGVSAAFEMKEGDRYGPSPVWDVVAIAIDVLAGEPGVRSVVVVTDGRVTGNRLGLREVITRAQSAGVSVSVIAEGRATSFAQDANTPRRSITPASDSGQTQGVDYQGPARLPRSGPHRRQVTAARQPVKGCATHPRDLAMVRWRVVGSP